MYVCTSPSKRPQYQILCYNHRYKGTSGYGIAPQRLLYPRSFWYKAYTSIKILRNHKEKRLAFSQHLGWNSRFFSLFPPNHTHGFISQPPSVIWQRTKKKRCSSCSKRGLLEGGGLRPVISLLLLQRAHCPPHCYPRIDTRCRCLIQ